jgi:hypothetical protein
MIADTFASPAHAAISLILKGRYLIMRLIKGLHMTRTHTHPIRICSRDMCQAQQVPLQEKGAVIAVMQANMMCSARHSPQLKANAVS